MLRQTIFQVWLHMYFIMYIFRLRLFNFCDVTYHPRLEEPLTSYDLCKYSSVWRVKRKHESIQVADVYLTNSSIFVLLRTYATTRCLIPNNLLLTQLYFLNTARKSWPSDPALQTYSNSSDSTGPPPRAAMQESRAATHYSSAEPDRELRCRRRIYEFN